MTSDELCDETNVEESPCGPRVLSRYITRKAKLVENTVLCVDYPVPSAIKNYVQSENYDLEGGTGEPFNMRYTVVTVAPEDFIWENGYDLRPRMYSRHTELFVAVTYYNEDKVPTSKFWNKGGPPWQKIVLCIVMDGVDACDKGTLAVLATVGLFQEGVLKKNVNGKDTGAHIFEYNTQLSVTPNSQRLKAQNHGKINSVRWVYNAFARILQPEVVVHIDTGTKVSPKSILTLWEAFYTDKNLGGASVSSQLEQALASSTGYLSVLPGAFSAYRCQAVIGEPLEAYFLGDPTLKKILGNKAALKSLYHLNRFLADDRVLPFHLIIKPGSKWHTRIIRGSVAETDRRRWLNGSLAASFYSLRMSYRLLFSGHNIPRMIVYQFRSVEISDITGDPPADSPVDGFPFGQSTPIANSIIQIIYLATVVVQFIIALGSRPRSHALTYIISFSIFALVQLINLAKRIIDFKLDTNGSSEYAYISEFYTDIGEVTILATAISLFGVYIAAGRNASWGHKSGKRFIRVTPVPILAQPTGIDASEQAAPGSQDIDAEFEQVVKRVLAPFEAEMLPVEDNREEKFMNFRTKLVAVYIFSNFLVCLIVMNDSFKSLSWLGDSYWHKI
ncbi:glycosyltransferase family 2 protein [Xylaria sp. FL0064]|nr:glycosyltransferase family 2 protein [Xylaria sp. FL0064]